MLICFLVVVYVSFSRSLCLWVCGYSGLRLLVVWVVFGVFVFDSELEFWIFLLLYVFFFYRGSRGFKGPILGFYMVQFKCKAVKVVVIMMACIGGSRVWYWSTWGVSVRLEGGQVGLMTFDGHRYKVVVSGSLNARLLILFRVR